MVIIRVRLDLLHFLDGKLYVGDVIYCTAPDVDKNSRSKWARALRYAAAAKPDDESIKSFFKRKGGINACASRYARTLVSDV
jgi:hypothetical protein